MADEEAKQVADRHADAFSDAGNFTVDAFTSLDDLLIEFNQANERKSHAVDFVESVETSEPDVRQHAPDAALGFADGVDLFV